MTGPVRFKSAGAAISIRSIAPRWRLTIKADLSLAIGDDPVAPGGLGAALDAATGGNRDARVFLRADRAVHYGDVMQVMNELRGGGYLKIALVALETRDGQ